MPTSIQPIVSSLQSASNSQSKPQEQTEMLIQEVEPRPLQVYSRRKKPTAQLAPVQVSKSAPKPDIEQVEVTTSTTIYPNEVEHVSDLPNSADIDLPIATHKGTRTCTQHPMHLFMSYKHLSPSHKTFLTNISSIPISKTVSEALSNKNWIEVMRVER